MKEHTLTKGSVGKGILLFVLPIIVGSLIQQLYVTIDAVVVGQFTGKLGLAAIDSVHTLFKFPLNFMNGLASGATIIISGHCGSKDEKQMHCSIRTACTVAVILGVICSVGGVLLTPWMLNVMSVPETVYGRAFAYTCIYFGGIWSMVLYNMAAGILRAYGDSKRPLYVLICCAVINIVGDLLLVGVLHLGVAGAALATVFSQIVSVVLTLYMLRKTLHISKEEQSHTDQCHCANRHGSSHGNSLADSLWILRTQVLCHKGGQRRSHGIRHQPDQHIQFITNSPGCNLICTHSVDTCLYNAVGNGKQHGLECQRESHPDHLAHMLCTEMGPPERPLIFTNFQRLSEHSEGKYHTDNL